MSVSAFADIDSNNQRRDDIVESLKDKEYREILVEEHISVGLPIQIHELRKRESWTQKELGDRSGQAQTRISLLERVGYDAYTVKTLTKLAAAFDLALIVKFAPFSELADRMASFSSYDVLVARYKEDPGLYPLAVENVSLLTKNAAEAANISKKKRSVQASVLTQTKPQYTTVGSFLQRTGEPHGTAISKVS